MRASSSGERERLDQVVVRSAVQPDDPVLDRVFRGENQNRSLKALLARSSQDLESAAAGKHQVQKQKIEGLCRGQEEPFFSVTSDGHGIVFGLQALFEGSGDLHFVFHQQNPHGLHPP
jgi:hypothetical protein